MTDSETFKFKSKFVDNTNNADITNVKMADSLTYLSNCQSTIEISLIDCELTWSAN